MPLIGLAILPVKLDTPAARVQLCCHRPAKSRLQFRFQKTNDPYVRVRRAVCGSSSAAAACRASWPTALEKLARMVCEQRGVRFSSPMSMRGWVR